MAGLPVNLVTKATRPTMPTVTNSPVITQNTAMKPPNTGVTSTTPTQTAVQPTTVMPTAGNGAFMPATVAGFNPQQVEAFDRLTGQTPTNNLTEWAGDMFKSAWGDYAPKAGSAYDAVMEYSKKLGADPNKFDVNTMVSPYMNKYVEGFIDPTVARLKRERDIRESEIKGRASRVGAFGDTTDKVQRSLNEGEYDRNLSEFLGNAYKGAYDDALTASRGQFNTEEDRRINSLNSAISGFGGAGSGYMGILNSIPGYAKTAYATGTDVLDRERGIAKDIWDVGDRAQQLEQAKLNEVERLRSGLSDYDWNQIQKLMQVTKSYPTTGTTTTSPGASGTDIASSIGGLVSGSWDKWFPQSNTSSSFKGVVPNEYIR